MQSSFGGSDPEFLTRSDALRLLEQVSSRRVPIGRQLFHSRPYGAIFDLIKDDEDTLASEGREEAPPRVYILTHVCGK